MNAPVSARQLAPAPLTKAQINSIATTPALFHKANTDTLLLQVAAGVPIVLAPEQVQCLLSTLVDRLGVHVANSEADPALLYLSDAANAIVNSVVDGLLEAGRD